MDRISLFATTVAAAGAVIIPPICDEIGVDWPPGSLRR
jgi:hypothetical protein